MKSLKRYKFNDSFTDFPNIGNLVASAHDCEYGIFDNCFACDPSVKDCLICHRALMSKTRKDYLNFYKNIFLPWNNERKGGDADGERLSRSTKK